MSPGRYSRLVLLLILLLCLLPLLAAWFSYRYWPPAGGYSAGELLPTQPFAAASRADWPGKRWVLAGQFQGRCEQACQQRLFTMRQIHLAQGEAAGRLRRVLLYSAAAPAAAEGFVQLAVASDRLPARADGFYLIDPLGNQVLFYPDVLQPDMIIKEVQLLMKVNNGLG
ncbi:hypothetical protein EAY64_10590 [Aquitalea palustris]|uniref:Cytochrome C oxidase subunit I n=1 Tax=Aquitalea palustris TaxID=2480983 RepID=A0A454JI49_9NEIS|nr:hypothetical protein [Aquitalea palustris]RMC97104.1 hypothetical protein EAY64_10590 [Aquitalea palustris]